jgi:DNA-binding CsgD family transcriptional regulator
MPELSERERQVLRALSQGLTTREAAQHLGLSRNTVKAHLEAARHKTGATSRREAIDRARRLHGL